MTERRRYTRHPTSLAFFLHLGIQSKRIVATDVSSSGLRFSTDLRLLKGQKVILAPVDSLKKRLRFIGEVVQVKGNSRGYEVRIRFSKRFQSISISNESEPNKPHTSDYAPKSMRIGNLHLVRLTGNYHERVTQYCKLIGSDLLKGPLLRLAKRNQRVLMESAEPGTWGWKQRLTIKFYDWLFIPWLGRLISKKHRQALQIISSHSEISYSELTRAYLQPEGFMLLLRLGILRYFLPGIPLGGFPGCSSFTIQSGKSSDKSFLFARNQDYPVVDTWENYPVIAFHEPKDAQRYISIASAGIFFGGLTGINESGITIALHAHFGLTGRIRSSSILGLVEQILEEAHSLQDAIDLVQKAKVDAAWSIFVASRDEMTSCVIEISAKSFHVRFASAGLLCNTNVFSSKTMRDQEGVICGGTTEDFAARYLRMQQMLDENAEKPTGFSSAIEILGDMTDYYSGEQRAFGNTIGAVTTIKSVVFDLKSNEICIAIDPITPTSVGRFAVIPLDRVWENRGFSPRIISCNKTPKAVKTAMGHFRSAYIWWHTREHSRQNRKKALVCLIEAYRANSEDPHVMFHLGNLLFKHRRFCIAQKIYLRVQTKHITPHLSAVCQLQVARTLDIQGKRAEALARYSHVLGGIEDQRLSKAFKQGIRRPFRRGEERRLLLDLQFLDLMQY